MTYEQILTETRGRVGVITLNRPDRLNAMTATMHRDLRAQMREWNVDEGVGAMVITGAGRGFCSGGHRRVRAGRQRQQSIIGRGEAS